MIAFIDDHREAHGHPDLRIEALDVVVGGFGSDIELAGRFLRRVPSRDQPQDLDLARVASAELGEL